MIEVPIIQNDVWHTNFSFAVELRTVGEDEHLCKILPSRTTVKIQDDDVFPSVSAGFLEKLIFGIVGSEMDASATSRNHLVYAWLQEELWDRRRQVSTVMFAKFFVAFHAAVTQTLIPSLIIDFATLLQ